MKYDSVNLLKTKIYFNPIVIFNIEIKKFNLAKILIDKIFCI